MSAATAAYAAKVPAVEQTFVQFLMPAEIRNLVDRYGLQFIGELGDETQECGCGCGCSG